MKLIIFFLSHFAFLIRSQSIQSIYVNNLYEGSLQNGSFAYPYSSINSQLAANITSLIQNNSVSIYFANTSTPYLLDVQLDILGQLNFSDLKFSSYNSISSENTTGIALLSLNSFLVNGSYLKIIFENLKIFDAIFDSSTVFQINGNYCSLNFKSVEYNFYFNRVNIIAASLNEGNITFYDSIFFALSQEQNVERSMILNLNSKNISWTNVTFNLNSNATNYGLANLSNINSNEILNINFDDVNFIGASSSPSGDFISAYNAEVKFNNIILNSSSISDKIFHLHNLQSLLIQNFIVNNQSSTFSQLFHIQSQAPTCSISFINVSIINSTGINFVKGNYYCLSNLSFENFLFENSSSNHNETAINLNHTCETQQILTITNISVLQSSYGGFLKINQQSFNPQLQFNLVYVLSDWNMIKSNFSLSKVEDNSVISCSDYVELLFENNFISDSLIKGGVLFNGSITNFLLINNSFKYIDFQDAQFIKTESHENIFELSALFLATSNLFSDITAKSKSYSTFIQNELLFTIFTNNIIRNVSLDGFSYFYFTKVSTQNISNFDPEFVNFFENLPYLVTFFNQYFEKGHNIYCMKVEPFCLLNFISGNIFHEFSSLNPQPLYLYGLSNDYQFATEISNNIYVKMINVSFYSMDGCPVYFSNNNEILLESLVWNQINFLINPNQFIYENHSNIRTNADLYIAIEAIFNNNFNYIISVSMNNSIFFQGSSKLILDTSLYNLTTAYICRNIFENYVAYTNQFEQIGFLSLSSPESLYTFVKFANNSFSNIYMTSRLTSTSFILPFKNYFIQLLNPLGTATYFVNNTFSNLQLDAKLTIFMNIQNGILNINNTFVSNLNISNAVDFPIMWYTPNLLVYNTTFDKIRSSSITFYFTKTGLIENVFGNVYSQIEFGLQMIDFSLKGGDVKGWMFHLQTELCVLALDNISIENIDKAFNIQFFAGSITVKNVNYQTSYGKFMKISGEGNQQSLIRIINFSQINQLSLASQWYSFEVGWSSYVFYAKNIYLVNSSLITSPSYFGYMQIQNVTLNNSKISKFINIAGISTVDLTFSQFYFKNSRIDEILTLNNTKQSTATFSNIIVTDSQIKKGFDFLINSTNDVTFDLSFSGIIINNVTGNFFIKTPLNSSAGNYLQISNMIFINNSIGFLSTYNFNITFDKIIYYDSSLTSSNFINASPYLVTILDLKNITIYKIHQGNNHLFEILNYDVNMSSFIFGSSVLNIYTSYSNLSINNSFFTLNNNPSEFGTCFNSNNSNISVFNSDITLNSGQVGAFYYKSNELINDTGEIYIENCHAEENFAYLYGTIVASQPIEVNLKPGPISQNQALFQLYYPQITINETYGLLNSSFTVLDVSASVIDYFLYDIVLKDLYNQTICYDSSTEFNLTVYYPNLNLYNQIPVVVDSLQKTISFPASSIITPPVNSSQTVIILAYYYTQKVQVKLDIFARDCIAGEFYDSSTSSCRLCPPDYFSLNIQDSCEPCPKYATCPGGIFISVEENYWIDPGTSNIYPCLSDGVLRCLGGIDQNGQCQTGYTGALCMGCNFTSGYSQSGANLCKQCDIDLFSLWVKNGVYFLFSFGIELIFIYLANKSNKKYLNFLTDKSNDCAADYMNTYMLSAQTYVFNYFMQMAFLIFTYLGFVETNITSVLDHFQLLLFISSSQSQQISDFDCLLIQMGYPSDQVTYFKVTAGTILPFAKMIFVCIFLFIKNIRRPYAKYSSKIWLVILSFLTLDQIGILQSLSKITTCINGGFVGFSEMDPNINCDSTEFLDFKNSVVYPAFIFWGIILPLFLIFLLYYLRNKRTDPKIVRIMGGLLTTVSDETYYWKIVHMLVKLGFLATFSIVENPKDATLIVLLIMVVYMYLLNNKHPYRSEEYGEDERRSAVAIFISLVFFNQAIDNSNSAVDIYSVAFFAIYGVMMIYFAIKIYTKFRKQRKIASRRQIMPLDKFRKRESTKTIEMNEARKKETIF